jgi:hypothetical protein
VSVASHIDHLRWSRYVHYHDFNSELRSLGRIASSVATAKFERRVERRMPNAVGDHISRYQPIADREELGFFRLEQRL